LSRLRVFCPTAAGHQPGFTRERALPQFKPRFLAAGWAGHLSDNALAAVVNVNFVLHAGQIVLPF
jgi:hypothetical protein